MTMIKMVGGGTGVKALSVEQFFDYLQDVQGGADDARTHYAKVAWIYRAVNLRAGALASIPFTIYQGEDEFDWPKDINLVRLLRVTEADLCLRGAAYWLKVASPLKLVELQRLNPWTVMPKITEEGIQYFEQRLKDSRPRRWKPKEIVYFDHLYNPRDDLGPGVSPADVAGVPASLVTNMNVWAVNFFRHGAIPAVILTTEAGSIPDAERKRIENVWKRMLEGVKKAWRTVVLTHGLQANVIGPPVKELAMPELDTRTKEQIAAAYGIPMGLLEQGPMNRATAEVHQVSLYTETVIPEAHQVQETVNEQVMEELGLRMEFHPEQIEAIQAREAEKAGSVAQVLNQVNQSALNSLLRPHEARFIIDLSLQSLGYPSLADIEPPEAEPSNGAGRQSEMEPPDESKKGFAPAGGPGPPEGLWSELTRWRSKAARVGESVEFESEVIPEWLAVQIRAAQDKIGPENAFLFLKQAQSRATIERRLRRALRLAMRRYEDEVADIVASNGDVDYTPILQDFRRVLTPEMELINTQRVLELATEVGIPFDPAVINIEAAQWARRHGGELARGLTDTTRNLVREATATFVETPGMSKRDLTKLLVPAFGDARAEMIAVTEVTNAYSQATNYYQERLRGEGLDLTRVWHTAADDRVCLICGPLDGQPEQDWPPELGDGPPAHVRCRCSVGLSARPTNELRRDHRRLQRERVQSLEDWPAPNTGGNL